jgi:hypothetical protein
MAATVEDLTKVLERLSGNLEEQSDLAERLAQAELIKVSANKELNALLEAGINYDDASKNVGLDAIQANIADLTNKLAT